MKNLKMKYRYFDILKTVSQFRTPSIYIYVCVLTVYLSTYSMFVASTLAWNTITSSDAAIETYMYHTNIGSLNHSAKCARAACLWQRSSAQENFSFLKTYV